MLQKVHLVAFPPYAPDHNPIERVWKDAKAAVSNFQSDDFDQALTAFETHIAGRKLNYRI